MYKNSQRFFGRSMDDNHVEKGLLGAEGFKFLV